MKDSAEILVSDAQPHVDVLLHEFKVAGFLRKAGTMKAMTTIEVLDRCIRLGSHLNIHAEGLGECVFTANLTFIGQDGFKSTSNHSLQPCLDYLAFKVEQDGVLDRIEGKEKRP